MNVVFVILVLLSTVASSKSSEDQTIFYCPQEIQCMENGNKEACYASDNQFNAWDMKGIIYDGKLIKGIYKLNKVISWYQVFNIRNNSSYTEKYFSLEDSSPVSKYTCQYNNIDDLGIKRLIGLNPQQGIFTDVIIKSKSNWNVVGYSAECLTDNTVLCPLSPANIISTVSSNLHPLFLERSNGFAVTLTYSDILEFCDTGSTCKINVVKPEHDHSALYLSIGTIEIDITQLDYFKIVRIETDPLSDCLLKKKEPFNLIYCDPKKYSR